MLVFPIIGISARAQWHEDAWAGHRACITQQLYAAHYSATVTNWTTPTNSTTVTVDYLCDIHQSPYFLTSATHTVYFHTPAFDTNGALYLATQVVTQTAAVLPTNLVLRDREICQWDMFEAVQERYRVTALTNFIGAYYFGEREALSEYKHNVMGMLSSDWWVDKRKSDGSNFPAYYASNMFPMLKEGTVLTNAPFINGTGGFDIIPTNFAAWTPWQIFLTNSPYGHFLTSTITFAASGTFTALDSCAQSHVITATNGQQVVLVCTNFVLNTNSPYLSTGVWEGWTSDVYCWWPLRQIITNVSWAMYRYSAWTGSAANVFAQGHLFDCSESSWIRDGAAKTYALDAWTARTDQYYVLISGYPTCDHTSSVLSASFETNNHTFLPGFLSAVSKQTYSNEVDKTGPWGDQEAWLQSAETAFTFALPFVCTNGGVPGELYDMAHAPTIIADSTNITFDAYSTGLSTNFQSFSTLAVTGTFAVTIGDTNNTAPSWPSISDGSVGSERGYVVSQEPYLLAKWDQATNEFRFRFK